MESIVSLSAFVALALSVSSPAAGDRIETKKGSLEIRPLHHATFVLLWDRKVIAVDPTGGKERFAGLPAPDLILITDIHGDHLDAKTVKALRKEGTTIVAPPAVAARLAESGVAAPAVRALANGESVEVLGIGIRAVPMYNRSAERQSFHPKGRGNGYVLDLGGTRVYFSGDTEDIPEMRALKGIDVAFVCMNLPFTMTAEQAASAVLELRPRVVYPYHYRGRGEGGTQDPERFRRLVAEKSGEIEVRVRDWYRE